MISIIILHYDSFKHYHTLCRLLRNIRIQRLSKTYIIYAVIVKVLFVECEYIVTFPGGNKPEVFLLLYDNVCFRVGFLTKFVCIIKM